MAIPREIEMDDVADALSRSHALGLGLTEQRG
jgi:hypothetical protein